MRVLILGGGGMLGHKLYQVLRYRCEVHATFRRFDARLRNTGVFDPAHVIDGIDAWDTPAIRRVLSKVRPDWVVNCIGIIKQLDEARDAKASIYVNALFPHLVCECVAETGGRVVQISTDCVFSGTKGDYVEEDLSDAEDLYGKTKYLGEVPYDHAITVRTSIVGRDLFSDVSLIDWFLSQSGKRVKGYTNAFYTGLSTQVLSEEIWRLITQHSHLHGLYHVASSKISKFDLLTTVNRVFRAGVTLEPFDDVRCDRSLRADRYRAATHFAPPSWEEMVAGMANDPTPYGRFREMQD
jgi:dTDP-4-dehydrorhamnose reductase